MVSKKSSCKIQAKYEPLSLRKSSENQNEKRKKLRKFKTSFFFPYQPPLTSCKVDKGYERSSFSGYASELKKKERTKIRLSPRGL